MQIMTMTLNKHSQFECMEPVAQSVRALVCGTRGRGFDSHQAPYQKDALNAFNRYIRHFSLFLNVLHAENNTPLTQQNHVKRVNY